MSKKVKKADSNLENVEEVLSRTELFIEENQKVFTSIIISLIVLIGGYWAVKKLFIEPREQEAQAQIFHAQAEFGNENFQVALEGDGNTLGFLDLIESYGRTKAGELANYYAGISYLHLEEYENAIRYLNKFNSKNSELKAVSLGAMGDAYFELENLKEAVRYYKRAIDANSNEITAPYYLLKIGVVYESLGDNKNAVDSYTKIKEQYKNSAEARQIDKYITRANLNL